MKSTYLHHHYRAVLQLVIEHRRYRHSSKALGLTVMVDIGVNLSTCSYFAATLFCAMALGLRAITPTLIRVMSDHARTCDRLMP